MCVCVCACVCIPVKCARTCVYVYVCFCMVTDTRYMDVKNNECLHVCACVFVPVCAHVFIWFFYAQSRLELIQAEADAANLAAQQWARICDTKENQLTQMKLKLARLLTEKRSARAHARDAQRSAVITYRKLLVDVARAKFKRKMLKEEVWGFAY